MVRRGEYGGSESVRSAPATDVQAAVKAWTSSTSALGSNAQTISDLRAELAAAEAAQEGLRRDWMAARRQVVSTVTVFAAGSADTITGFNLDVIHNGRLGLLSAPEGLSVNAGSEPGEIVATPSTGSSCSTRRIRTPRRRSRPRSPAPSTSPPRRSTSSAGASSSPPSAASAAPGGPCSSDPGLQGAVSANTCVSLSKPPPPSSPHSVTRQSPAARGRLANAW